MICPVCGKDVLSRVFYDHMGEYHGWSLSEAEKYADDLYWENRGYDHPNKNIGSSDSDKGGTK